MQYQNQLTTTEAARLLGITPAAVRMAIIAGRLPASKHGRDWLVTPAAVDAYARTRQAGDEARLAYLRRIGYNGDADAVEWSAPLPRSAGC